MTTAAAGSVGTTRRSASSRSIERGLDLLDLLAARPAGWTIAELAVALGIGRASVYRLLVPFQARGYARRGADGRVHLGLGVLALARRAEPALLAAATPVLRDLAERVGATAHLAVREGDDAVALAVVEPSWTDVHVAYRVGTRHPVDAAAAGRALQALRADDGPAWCTSAGELEPGAHGVAAPVRELDAIEASVGVVALRPLDPEVVGPALVAAAAALAAALTERVARCGDERATIRPL
jgi:DNA-binding IclR family transcriptional regulator